ncbi:MAG: type I-B CRISPR-associated protein Cas7/Cst2/DevR [Candidatus Cloacimonadaceae bacterium]|nr:type I-B CRISPR-associated protein Cas7/Cst2/DevR [Candidatus Cloacimonadaceae bacterium]MDP3115107.1 type I-B CRISPR-associated protein Cas7/Cst2/DevR [Candidatus Cloacimonadaceae bacterium]
MNTNYKPTSITITYLAKISYASLNGGDSDTDNINVIKKITAFDGTEYPYVSSQALRRALRDQLGTLGCQLSPISTSGPLKESTADSGDENDANKKHPPITRCDPVIYIDDDLFGYLNAQTDSIKRTSPIRVSPLVALSKYMADLDFGTNYMGKDEGLDPNIFETEMHRGLYRGTIMIELDRVGTGDGFVSKPTKKKPKKGETIPEEKDMSLTNEQKAKRVLVFLDAFQNLWSSGRQSRFLADISPKFIAAAYLSCKNPIFLESIDHKIDITVLKSVVEDYKPYIYESVFASQSSVFPAEEGVKSLGDGFAAIRSWVTSYYQN